MQIILLAALLGGGGNWAGQAVVELTRAESSRAGQWGKTEDCEGINNIELFRELESQQSVWRWWVGGVGGLEVWLTDWFPVLTEPAAACGGGCHCSVVIWTRTRKHLRQQTSSQVCRVQGLLLAQSFTELTHELTGAISVKSVAARIVKQVRSNQTHGYLIFPARWHLTVTIEPHQLSHCAPRKLIILRVQTKLNTQLSTLSIAFYNNLRLSYCFIILTTNFIIMVGYMVIHGAKCEDHPGQEI